jgi:hypothetical protein
MKLKIVIFLFAFLILVPSLVSADFISPDQHVVTRCLKIVNLDKFPDLVLIGFYSGVGLEPGEKYVAYQVKNDVCLTKGYKFNKLDIFWTTQKKFAAMNLNDLDIKTSKAPSGQDRNGKTTYYNIYSPKNLELLVEKVGAQDALVNNTSSLIKETIEYSLERSFFGGLSWYKSRRITDYNDGSPQKIETFQAPGATNDSSSTTVNSVEAKKTGGQGFWRSLFCFFKISSAKNCR